MVSKRYDATRYIAVIIFQGRRLFAVVRWTMYLRSYPGRSLCSSTMYFYIL